MRDEVIGWNNCLSIYKYLSHHYILKRSVVFIVDSQFDSVLYRDKAMKYVSQFYGQLTDEDYFGYISLDSSNYRDEIILESTGMNRPLKKKLLKEFQKRAIDYVFNRGGQNESSKTLRLERALTQAYEWQNNLVDDFDKEVNGVLYKGPLKWIICLLGDDIYTVN